MPLTIPAIDNRTYQELRDEALARIPVHNPEWTNFNRSDPGVTLVEIFAFLTESLLYRANQIPERNRRKFLKLLGQKLMPATAARGIVAFTNERGPIQVTTLPTEFAVEAGPVSFLIDRGLDVLPVEGRVFYKHEVKNPPQEIRDYYNQLYASFLGSSLSLAAKIYESLPFGGDGGDGDGVDLARDTTDRSLWLALVARKDDVPADKAEEALKEIRERLGGKTLTLGVVPWLTDARVEVAPGGKPDGSRSPSLVCQMPRLERRSDGTVKTELGSDRRPQYRTVSMVGDDVLARPGTLQVQLPPKDELQLWSNLDPLESGVGDFPPAIADTNLENRIVTWLRFSVSDQVGAKLRWVGINAATVTQRVRVRGERLSEGTGAPDQLARLALKPVLRNSVRLFVTRPGASAPEQWSEIDDLTNAQPEVPSAEASSVAEPPRAPLAAEPVPASPPETPPAPKTDPRVHVYVLDAEAGELRFGDGLRGARPPLGAELVVDYEYSEGREGNVNADAIKTGPLLPPGFIVKNPIPTWGGAEAETTEEGEKQTQRWLQHRDRLVSADDFATIAWRTPGVEIARIEVIPAWSPEVGTNEPGDAPGAVTLMIIPVNDPARPDAPQPDRLLLNTVCAWLDPRRLVTTELFLRGPIYKEVWVSVGIDVATERSIAEVRVAVEQALRQALAPVPPRAMEQGTNALLPVFTRQTPTELRGWPLRKPVVAIELAAVAARVPGVTAVHDALIIGKDDTESQPSIDMKGLELPRVMGILVSVGPAVPVTELRGMPGQGREEGGFVPVPVVPEEC